MYNVKELIKKCNSGINNYDLEGSRINELQIIIHKLNNIDTIIENLDNELLKHIEDDYNFCVKYAEQISNGEFDIIGSFSDKLDLILNKLIKLVDFSLILDNKSNIKNKIKNYKTVITIQKNKTEEEANRIIDEIHTISQSVRDKNSELNQELEKLSNQINELEEDNKKNSLEINNYLNDKTKTISNQLAEDSTKYNDQYKKILEEYSTKFDQLYIDLQQKNKNVSELVSIVTKKGKIGEYKKYADSSKLERIIWQIITVLLFAGSLIIGLIALSKNNFDKFTIIKYIISVIMMSAAAYTAKQASNAKRDESYYRKQQLELASIDTYLEGLEPDIKQGIKKDLANSFFGQAKNMYSINIDDKK